MSVMARPRDRPTPCFQYGVIGECDGRGWRIGFHNLQDMGSHDSGNLRDDRNHDRISELAVRLGVRYRNAEIVGISHKTGAFAWRQPPWTVSLLGDEDLGAILVVACRQGPGHHVWRDQSVSESMSHGLVLRLVVLFQLSPVDLNQVITTGTAALTYGEAEEKAILKWVDELNLRDGGDFPKGETVSAKAREIQEKIYDHTEYLRINPDLKLIEYTRVEYALFRHMEQAKYMDSVRDGFDDLDAFVQLALSLLNSRKSRAGKGFENQIGAILTANGLLFQEQVKTEGSKRPDFVFPSGAAYHDMGRSPDKLVVLAAKTTCKDRWRQILTEAKRMENEPKWLITLQQGNSVQQLNEMMEDNVRLVVPEPYIRSYPAEYRGSIWPFKKFIGYVREHAQD